MPKNVKLVPLRDLNVYSNYHILTLKTTAISDSMECFSDSIQSAIEEGLNHDGEQNAWIERYDF